ncbi:MAG: hypothetical protein JWO46_651 [Nocardioidaceae bacterium]|nr:hypothetical protein [Nocardioidaceae bacterium]
MPQQDAIPEGSGSALTRVRKPIREAQKEMTRSRLMEAGLEVFVERGFDEATVEEITDRAGVGRTTFYTHFDGKAEVAIAIALAETGPLNRCVAELGDTDPDLLDTILAWLSHLERQFRDQSLVVTLVMQYSDVTAEFLKLQERSADEVLTRFAARGWVVSNDDAAEHVRLMLMLVNRWLYLHIVNSMPAPSGSRESLGRLLQTQLSAAVHRSR